MHAHRQPVHLPPLERGIRLHSSATVRSIRSERCAQFAAQPIGRDYRAVRSAPAATTSVASGPINPPSASPTPVPRTENAFLTERTPDLESSPRNRFRPPAPLRRRACTPIHPQWLRTDRPTSAAAAFCSAASCGAVIRARRCSSTLSALHRTALPQRRSQPCARRPPKAPARNARGGAQRTAPQQERTASA